MSPNTSTETTHASTPAPRKRPPIEPDPRRVRGFGGVWIMLRRELATKLWTSAFALSTALFALLALSVPLLSGGDDDPPTLAHTGATSALATTAAGLDDQLTLKETASGSDGRTLLSNGEVDAVLVPDEGDRGNFRVLVEDSLDQQLATTLQSALRNQALRQTAAENGVDADALARDLRTASLPVVTTGEKIDMTGVLTGLSFAAGALLIILLWGIPLATDVMQEKASRVVEILLTSVRPWQLLAGKVVTITIIGLVQLIVILGSATAGSALGGQLPDLGGTSTGVIAVGAVCLVFSIVTCGTLMAGLAARVERQEDLNSALQPAMAGTLLPMAAAFYLAFDSADSRLLDAASMAPVFNLFVLPPRLAIESVPLWQVVVSFAVALLTAAAAFWIAGRIYSGSILRSGGRVPWHEAVRHR